MLVGSSREANRAKRVIRPSREAHMRSDDAIPLFQIQLLGARSIACMMRSFIVTCAYEISDFCHIAASAIVITTTVLINASARKGRPSGTRYTHESVSSERRKCCPAVEYDVSLRQWCAGLRHTMAEGLVFRFAQNLLT